MIQWRHLGILLALSGCIELDGYACQRDEQCVLEEQRGVCTVQGFCAFEDERCDSGWSFQRGAPASLRGTCLSTDAGSDAGSDGANATTGGVQGTTSTSGGSSETGFACGDRPCGCATAIVAGQGHTCALRDDGEVVCWGLNNWGQLGRGTTSDTEAVPERVALPDAHLPVVAISSGNVHTCALLQDGSSFCWGMNDDGEVLPSEVGVSQPTPILNDWVPGAAVVGAMSNHSCAFVAATSTTTCWGRGNAGQLGGGNSGPGPAVVSAPGELLASVTHLDGGRNYVCGLSGERAYCWGSDVSGQLGDGEATASGDVHTVPIATPLGGLASGSFHVCASAVDGGGLWCWGRNDRGQLGLGDLIDRFEATAVTDAPPGIVRVSARLKSTCLLDEEHVVWCWGSNDGDMFGLTAAVIARPRVVPIAAELTEPPLEIAVGFAHICVITQGGHVWCWGNDDNEQLGPRKPEPGAHAIEVDIGCSPD